MAEPSIPRPAAIALTIAIALIVAPPSAAEYADAEKAEVENVDAENENVEPDIVVLINGDHLTGEVKKLARGKLSFKTSAADTIQIAWDEIVSVHAHETFDVETEDGERYFGSLAPVAADGKLEVIGDQESWILEHDLVVGLTPIEAGFWNKLHGYFDLGFSFTDADDRKQFSFGAETRYRTREYQRVLSWNTVIASQDDVDETNRTDLNFLATRYLQAKRHFLSFATLQSNEELGIDLRTLIGGSVGWNVVQTNTDILGLATGVALTWENLTGGEQVSIEAFLGLQFQSFRLDTPKRDIDINLGVFPSASDVGRVRTELRAKVRWELVKNLYFALTLLGSYDSAPVTPSPASGTIQKRDINVTTSLGWSF